MLTFWSLVLVWNFGQNPQIDKPGDPPAKAADAKKADEKAKAPDPKEPPKEPDSEHDKFVRAEADKLDKITSVSSEIVYASRNLDHFVQQKGTFKLGPNNRIRMELAFGEGPDGGKRLFVCDGTTAYSIDEFGEFKQAQMWKLDRIRPLLDDKNMPPEIKAQAWNGLVPYQKPGEMIRALLMTSTFTERRDDKLGERAVVRLEGRWRKSAIAMLAGGDATKTLEDIDPRVPRYVTLVLDKQTGWPLQLELFQRLPEGVVKPAMSIKFSKLTIGAASPDSEFKYTPPTTLTVRDATPGIEAMFKRVLDNQAAQNVAKAAADKKAAEEKKKP